MVNVKNETNGSSKIVWLRVSILTLLNMFFVFSWLIYDNFQATLLEKFHIQKHKFFLDCLHFFIMVAVPILAGWVADIFFNNKSKLLLVTIFVSITSIIFMATGFMTQINEAFEGMSVWFLILFSAWMIFMNLFNSPANSFVEKYAPASHLPLIVGLFTFGSELILSMESKIVSLLVQFGVFEIFIGAGLILAILGFVFFVLNRGENSWVTENYDRKHGSDLFAYCKIVIIGFVLGGFSGMVKFVLPIKNIEYDSFYVLFIAAVFSLIVGFSLKDRHLNKLYVCALLAGLIILFDVFNLPLFVFYIIAGLILSVLSVCSFPFVFKLAPKGRLVISIGVYTGAVEFIEGAIEMYLLYYM